jgi:hypothetical protein
MPQGIKKVDFHTWNPSYYQTAPMVYPEHHHHPSLVPLRYALYTITYIVQPIYYNLYTITYIL